MLDLPQLHAPEKLWRMQVRSKLSQAFVIPREADGDDVSSIVSAAATASQTADTILIVPRGTFLMDPVTVGAAGSNSTLHIFGEFYGGKPNGSSGSESVLKLKNSSNATMFTVSPNDASDVGPAPFVLQDITIDGNGANQTGTAYIIDHSNHTASANNARSGFYRRVYMKNARTSHVRVGTKRNAGVMEQVICLNSITGSSLQLGSNSDWRFINCDFGDAGGATVQDSGADSIFFVNCNFFTPTTHCYKADTTSGDHYFLNCSFDRAEQNGVNIDTASADKCFRFANCRFGLNGQQTNDTYADANIGSNNTKISFADCAFITSSASNKPQYNIRIASGGAVQAIGCTFETGAAVTGIVSGSDFTRIDNGQARFGTYTASAATDSTGYITIIDAGGTTRKLMVQA